MNQASEDRLNAVHPQLASRVRQLATMLAAEDIFIAVAQGLRTIAEQDALFAKGRDASGEIVNKGQIVTNARGGQSWHNFGLAVDCYPLEVNAVGIDWNPQHPAWKQMEQLGVSLGMTSGANWIRLVDAPHFQLTGRFPEGAPTEEVNELYKSGGLQAVWDAVTASLPKQEEPA